jgi:hypothetical protein
MGELQVRDGVDVVRPRPGAAGLYDLLVGPGATPLEEAGAWASASAGAIAGGLLPSTAPERLLGAVFGFDAGGGLWVNESRAGKRWYRRAGQPWWEPAGFAALHVHPFVVEAVSGRRDWRRAAVTWAGPVVASGVVALVERNTGRPLARRVALSLAGALGGTGAAIAPRGWRWLPALLAPKLIVGHATSGSPLASAIAATDAGERRAGR